MSALSSFLALVSVQKVYTAYNRILVKKKLFDYEDIVMKTYFVLKMNFNPKNKL
ncbi:hypothetical protein [Candidatus Endomicrobiellum agilis]|uniref:hypothetical protein n=1 Tax=Candidatus Endomicrobiellum agilis TaxID=3238957 RepID=UPI00358960E3|nr:hypothetical protein [Endomicrobium sp.]